MSAPNFASGTIWSGDNLDIMRGMNSECVDLIYLDPPFNSNRHYEAPIGSEAAGASFKDAWTLNDVDVHEHGELADRNPAAYAVIEAARQAHGKGMMAYLIMMAVRLLEMRRITKETGSIYLHCDPTAAHYLKLLLDAIFGTTNFIGEIVWRRHNARSAAKRWPRIHDTIFCVAKSHHFCFTPLKVAGDKLKIPHTLITGSDGRKYQTYELTGAGMTACGESGQPWKGYNPSAMGRHWANSRTKMNELDRAGLIHWSKKTGARGGFPRRRAADPFVPEAREVTVGDVWTDIDRINQAAKERKGYPTQKPLALLERIIRASSNPGDLVLDPFCGCATTLVAADRLQRKWAGIDLSPLAIKLVNERIAEDRGLWGGATALDAPPKRTDLGDLPNYRTHRHRLYGIQEGVCVGCETHFPFRVMDVDHMLPRSRGGTDHADNLQLLCSGCNRSKGGRTMAEWRAAQ